MTVDTSPLGLATLYGDLGMELSGLTRREDVVDSIAKKAVALVSGAEFVSLTQGRNGRFETVASTSEIANAADAVQYRLGSGPCVDAAVEDTAFRVRDLSTDPRWPEFGPEVASKFDLHSMLSFRLQVETDDSIAALNIYARDRDAFDDAAHTMGVLVATHASIGLTSVAAREKVVQLEQALQSNRLIGVAMGILMAEHKVTREQAFGLLRIASQNSNRKLTDVASAVAETGALPLPR